jgi:hypothetical protein
MGHGASNHYFFFYDGQVMHSEITVVLRLVSVGVSLEFHLYLMSCHVYILDDMTPYLRRERRNECHGDETLLVRIPTLYES